MSDDLLDPAIQLLDWDIQQHIQQETQDQWSLKFKALLASPAQARQQEIESPY